MTETDKASLRDLLHGFVLDTVPDAQTVSKYGGTLYTLKPEEKEGQFCGVFVYKEHLKLSFAQGHLLDDPDQVLVGNGKYRRHLKFRTEDELDAQQVAGFIRQAAYPRL